MTIGPKTNKCALAGRCSGCGWIQRPYNLQLERKVNELSELFLKHNVSLAELSSDGISSMNSSLISSVVEFESRDRADLTICDQDGSMVVGLYETSKSKIIDMDACPQMTPALESWFLEFRKNLPKIKVGSVRLRVAPDRSRGVWLDFANVDVKTLLDEKQWLTNLLCDSIVEVGQRKKILTQVPEGLKLRDPQFHPWFETYLGDHETPAPLFCNIASFTQPGFKANRALIAELRNMIKPLDAHRWLELFSGIGNFTLSLASWGKDVTSFENDELAVAGFQKTLEASALVSKIKLISGDVNRKGTLPELSGFDGLLVDPPRSGLKGVLNWLTQADVKKRPKFLVYVSCFPPTLAEDAAKLQELGYKIKNLRGVDQFPQTHHCEWLVLFKS